MKIAITGANSSVGLNLLNHIVSATDIDVIAGVRSDRAMKSLPSSPQIDPRIISYQDPTQLAEALEGADCIVHLAGILIEDKNTSYASANVDATEAVVKAAQTLGAKHMVFISVVGAAKILAMPTSARRDWLRNSLRIQALLRASFEHPFAWPQYCRCQLYDWCSSAD